MTTKKNTEQVLYFDNETFDGSLRELNYNIGLAEELAEIWNEAGCLEPLNGESFRAWIDTPELIEHLYEAEVNKRLETFWTGASKQKKKGLELFELDIPDREKMFRLLRSFRDPTHRTQNIFFDITWLSWTAKGTPYVADQTKELIREKCTIRATEANVKLFAGLERFCDDYNGLMALLEMTLQRKISLSSFRAIRIEEDKISPDARELFREIYHKTDPAYKYGIVAHGTSAITGASVGTPLRVPTGFKLTV